MRGRSAYAGTISDARGLGEPGLRDCKVESDFNLQRLHIGHGPWKRGGGLSTPAGASRRQVARHVLRGSGDIASRVAERGGQREERRKGRRKFRRERARRRLEAREAALTDDEEAADPCMDALGHAAWGARGDGKRKRDSESCKEQAGAVFVENVRLEATGEPSTSAHRGRRMRAAGSVFSVACMLATQGMQMAGEGPTRVMQPYPLRPIISAQGAGLPEPQSMELEAAVEGLASVRGFLCGAFLRSQQRWPPGRTAGSCCACGTTVGLHGSYWRRGTHSWWTRRESLT